MTRVGSRRRLERPCRRNHLVQHAPECPDVAPRVGFRALDLLGREVLKGADDGAVIGERRGACRVRRGVLEAGHGHDRCGLLRDAEVQELRCHSAGCSTHQHHIGWFQIAVHDAAPMRAIERVGDLDRHAQRLVDLHRTGAKSIGQRLSLEVFHDEELDATVDADVVQRADVRMIQRRDGARFAFEPLAERRVARQ
jgi:hypothetical protein